jgi:GNAT superfamily N-acetyltransferase
VTVEVIETVESSAPAISSAVTILPVSFRAILDAPNAADLLCAYAQDCLVPDAEPQRPLYEMMEKTGSIQCFGAYIDETTNELDASIVIPSPRLVGFISVFRTIVPHDGHLIAAVESFFVDPPHRLTGAAFLLLAAAELYATDAGCRCLLASARLGSALDILLTRRSGYERTHSQHTRWLNGYKGGRE